MTDSTITRAIRLGMGAASSANAVLKLWSDLRRVLEGHRYLQCADAVSFAGSVERFGAGSELLIARVGERALLQVGSVALQFAVSGLHALELTVAEPARGPGGYQWILWLREPIDQARIDYGHVDISANYSLVNTYDILLTTLHLASFLGVPMRYRKGMDV